MHCLDRTIPLAALVACLALAGCGKADNDPGPGGVSVGEARALDEAAAMIESRRTLPAEQEQPSAPTSPSGTAAK